MARGKKRTNAKKSKAPLKQRKNGGAKKAPMAKRDKELAGLNPRKFSRIKQEFHDIDYLDKLSPKEQEWLHRFMEEDLGARFNHSGKRIYKKKQEELDSYRRNNNRNFDIYSRGRAQGTILLDKEVINLADKLQNLETTNPEDSIIENIDLKKSLKKSNLV